MSLDSIKMALFNLSGFDCVLLAILGYSTLSAYFRGILRALLGLVGIVGGFVLATWNYRYAGHRLERWIEPEAAARLLAFLFIVLTVALVFTFLGRGLHRTARMIGLGQVDRLLGAVFGFARGVLLGVTAIIGVAALAPQKGWLAGSRLGPYFLDAAHTVSFVVPHNLQDQIYTVPVKPRLQPTHWNQPRRMV